MCGVYASIYVYRRGLCTESAITMKKNNGFTLIEILVAATIISVLSVIGATSYISINKRSRDAKRKSDLEQVRSALEMWRTDKVSYPGTTSWQTISSALGALKPDYVPALPTDPLSTQNYYYRTIGAVAPFYSYCICANLENQVGTVSTCGAGVTLPGDVDSCNYGLKNP